MTRATLALLAALGVALTARAAAQTVAQRVARAPDGTVHLSYAARDGVCGNGAGTISFHCVNGMCGNQRITTNSDWDDNGAWHLSSRVPRTQGTSPGLMVFAKRSSST